MANPSYPENDLIRKIAKESGVNYCRSFTNGYKPGSRLYKQGIRRRFKLWLCHAANATKLNQHPLMPKNATAVVKPAPSYSYGQKGSVVIYFT